jgi:hypothetical protein
MSTAVIVDANLAFTHEHHRHRRCQSTVGHRLGSTIVRAAIELGDRVCFPVGPLYRTVRPGMDRVVREGVM